MLRCPTSELPICPSGSPTARPLAFPFTNGHSSINLSIFGVFASYTAVIAYEPIWAIGTGKTATTEQAQEVCAEIRKCIAEIYDDATAAAIRIQYGGSVNAKTAPDLFAQADIDGGLVGGASLKADFGQIVNYNK